MAAGFVPTPHSEPTHDIRAPAEGLHIALDTSGYFGPVESSGAEGCRNTHFKAEELDASKDDFHASGHQPRLVHRAVARRGNDFLTRASAQPTTLHGVGPAALADAAEKNLF